jgi:hypothetical protein
MRCPADDELRDARVLPGAVAVEEGLLGEVVGAAGAGVELGHLSVAERGGETEHERAEDAHPHGGRGCAFGGLDEEGQPEERTGSNEGHGVAGEASQAQGGLHLCFDFFCHAGAPGEKDMLLLCLFTGL